MAFPDLSDRTCAVVQAALSRRCIVCKAKPDNDCTSMAARTGDPNPGGPPATYDQRSWRRWLFDRILDVEKHEAMEFFQVAGRRPYAPSHGPGNDPYMIREVGTDTDQRTSFRGDLKERDADPR